MSSYKNNGKLMEMRSDFICVLCFDIFRRKAFIIIAIIIQKISVNNLIEIKYFVRMLKSVIIILITVFLYIY